MPKAIVEEITCHQDHRGLVFEPLDAFGLREQKNVHVVLTEPGGIRGNHYHERGTEVSVVIGPALVRVREDGATRDILVAHGAAVRFTFPPRVSHAIMNTGAKALLVAAFNTEAFDRSQPDVVKDVLI